MHVMCQITYYPLGNNEAQNGQVALNFYIRFPHYSLGGSWSYWSLPCSNGMARTVLYLACMFGLNKHLLFVVSAVLDLSCT